MATTINKPQLTIIQGGDGLRDKSRDDINTNVSQIGSAVNELIDVVASMQQTPPPTLGEEQLQASIDAEATTRAQADTALSTRINGKADKDANGFLVNLVRRHWSTLNLVNDLGYAMDGVVDCSPGFDEAFDALDKGGLLTLNDGIAGVSRPVQPTKERQGIMGTGSGWWTYNTGTAGPCSIRPLNSFQGQAILLGVDRELNDDVLTGNCFFRSFSIDGNSKQIGSGTSATPINGVALLGEVKGWKFDQMAFLQASGHNVAMLPYQSSRGQVFPRGGGFAFCSSWSAGTSAMDDKWGWWLENYTDAYLTNNLAVSNQGGGFYIKGAGQLPISNCIAAYNINENGFLISGNTGSGIIGGGNGGVSLTNCYTDRNAKDGVLITASGPRSRVSIVGGDFRRDGPNTGAGDGGYAAIALRGTASNRVCAVDLVGVMTAVEDDDQQNQVWQPRWGVFATYTTELSITGGHIWGLTGGLSSTNSQIVRISDETVFWKGPPTDKVRSYPDQRTGKGRSVPVITNQSWAIPSAFTRFGGNGSLGSVFYMQMDTRMANFAKLTAQVLGGGAAGASLSVDYTTDLSGATGWTSMQLATLTVDSVGYRNNADWALVPDAAKGDVLIRIMGSGGDGTTTANFASIFFHYRP
ncbi:hypothetical protein GTQ99_00330 [Kineococcus sp. T13]|uniref:hypothetical protein n=1 Tax=Kineococcus vitellinus TaxID=2696565 RepID=UPI0014131071|nr:hypothetical protein [Kineococcus vitellinus]NAZ73877.1 hypothetical protein [Kineococcus vitellinus]